MRARPAATLLTLIALAACGGDAPPAESGTDAPAAAQQGADAAAITAADLDAYERGIAREIALVREAQAAYDTASTPQSRGALQQAQWEDATVAPGAQAAGMTVERYAAVRRAVHETMRTLDFQGKIDGPMSIDTTRADEATRARLRQDAYATLAPDAAAALRAREARIASLWGDYVRLVAVAG